GALPWPPANSSHPFDLSQNTALSREMAISIFLSVPHLIFFRWATALPARPMGTQPKLRSVPAHSKPPPQNRSFLTCYFLFKLFS
uniref:Uncharacterized protein n=1 Tax=Calidris pygmaea TaxID=425635 RepID=A0A8C3K8L8_9CHAR